MGSDILFFIFNSILVGSIIVFVQYSPAHTETKIPIVSTPVSIPSYTTEAPVDNTPVSTAKTVFEPTLKTAQPLPSQTRENPIATTSPAPSMTNQTQTPAVQQKPVITAPTKHHNEEDDY